VTRLSALRRVGLQSLLGLSLALGLGPGLATTARAEGLRGLQFSSAGFLSLVAGKVLGGTHDPATDQGYACPCFISDYAQNGVYATGGVRWAPDSKLGVQGTAATENGRYALTGQLVARGSRGSRVNLEWLYATAELSSDWTLQVGRKRLPLFMSSEVQDVGHALPWVHLPPQLYGWDLVNFNGASLTYRRPLGDWLASAQVLAGSETRRDSGYWQIYNGKGSRTDVRWSNIVGVETKLSHDWFEARAVFFQSGTQFRVVSDGETAFSPRARQRIHGLSFSAEPRPWFARAEFLYIDRSQDYGFDRAQLFAVGRRFGAWQAVVSYSNYRQLLLGDPEGAEAHRSWSAVLRRELDASSAVKLQLDRWVDKVGPAYGAMHGNARLLSVAYDRVF
jgi:hypothetical protein